VSLKTCVAPRSVRFGEPSGLVHAMTMGAPLASALSTYVL
jgi:hypothetical protein